MKAFHTEPIVKPDLMKFSQEGRDEVIKLIREQFRQMVKEERLWQTMLHFEDSPLGKVEADEKRSTSVAIFDNPV